MNAFTLVSGVLTVAVDGALLFAVLYIPAAFVAHCCNRPTPSTPAPAPAPTPTTPAPKQKAQDAPPALEGLNIRQLKKLASERKIKRYGSMRKAQLIEVLSAIR